ncbi:MAG: hypothetical protein HKN68_12945, partial [Saprospiraceae bacterium]|nr:hypothetical protein [Saprospiraceae bacterium]
MKNLLTLLIAILFASIDISAQYAESWTDYMDGMPMPPGQEIGNSRDINNNRSATYYTDRTMFQAANPGFPLEDFEAGAVLPFQVTGCDEPMNDASSDACFTPGGLIPGFSLSTFEGIRAGCPANCPLVILGDGLIGNADIVVGPNFFGDTYLITFSPPVSAAGMDLHVPAAETFDIVITDGNGMTTMTTASATPAGTFWGVECPELIASIQLISPAGAGELIDNLEFGIN